MTEQIRPALTREEWTRAINQGRGNPRASDSVFERADTPEACHYIAALALHDQPFGFTREDVEALRACVDGADREDAVGIGDEGFCVARHALAKLAALLPPEPYRYKIDMAGIGHIEVVPPEGR